MIVRIVCRPRLAVQRTMLRAMMAQDGTPSRTALWLLAYTWLLRLPSEALPMCVCASEPQRGVHQSAVWREGDNICVLLSSRKNLQGGSGVLRRACSCEGSPHMCPVHVLWEQFLDSVPVGTKPWLNVSAAQVLKWMRCALIAFAVRTSACCTNAICRILHAGTKCKCLWHSLVDKGTCSSMRHCTFLWFATRPVSCAARTYWRVGQLWPRFFVLVNGKARLSCDISILQTSEGALCSKWLATLMTSSGSISRSVCPSALTASERFSHHFA